MRALLLYKIKNPALKRRFNSLLLNFGQRPFINAFECNLGEGDFKRLSSLLASFPFEEGDHAVLYPLCLACFKNISVFGSGHEPFIEDSSYIIL